MLQKALSSGALRGHWTNRAQGPQRPERKGRGGMMVDDERPNGNGRILAASLVGTAIEFYDFYIYATAA